MIGTKVERAGIIRAGAKMISAVSEASVPKISVVVRKAYGAGLYAMCGPGFSPDCTLVLPQAMIAVMGPEAAVNAVYFNKIQELPEAERPAYVARLREEYRADVDIFKLAAELVVDEVVQGDHRVLSAGDRAVAVGVRPELLLLGRAREEIRPAAMDHAEPGVASFPFLRFAEADGAVALKA